MEKRLFRRSHPVLFGLFVLAGIFLMFWGGMTFFLTRLMRPQHAELFSGKAGVGVIEVKGVITSAEELTEQLADFRRNTAVKAVVVRIDSPGGSVGASQELFEEIQRIDQTKPVVASMASVAASGGYYAALGARKILANPGTLTGSIGVIIKFANLQELFAKIGYQSEVIKSGALKDTGAMDRPLTAEERRVLQDVIDNVHRQFVATVAKERALPEDKVRRLADGRIFSGEQAKALGLIDQLGNFTDAVTLAASLAGLDTKDPRLIYPEDDDFSLFHMLGRGNSAGSLLNLIENHSPVLSYQWAVNR